MPLRRIYADVKELFVGAPTLILDADAAIGAGTITVKNITGIAINKILFFREAGNESAEIVATHSSTAPSGTTVTLASALVRAHPAGTTVYLIPANQVRFYRSATQDDANSSDSNLTALAAATAIDPTLTQQVYDDSTYTSGYYYYRFIDSINSINLLYSDPLPWVQSRPRFDINTVGYAMEFVRRKLSFDWDEKFSKEAAMDEANACLSYIKGKLNHWSRYLVADYALGQTARGVFDYALPSNIYDNETNKSVLQVRLGTNTHPLIWKDEREFDQLVGSAIHSTVRTAASAADTSLAIVNSYDFDDSGDVHVYSSNVDDSISYTAVTRSTTVGALTGISASGGSAITASHAVGDNVWQNPSEGEPIYFNIRNGRFRVWPLPDSDWINKNVYLDYWQQGTSVDSEGDTLDAPRYDMVKHWLLWKAKSYLRNNGVDDQNDTDFKIFSTILVDAIKKEKSGQKFKMKPKINQIMYIPVRKGTFETE